MVFMDVGMVFMDVELQAGAAAGRYVWGKYGRAPHAALFPRKDNHLPCPYVYVLNKAPLMTHLFPFGGCPRSEVNSEADCRLVYDCMAADGHYKSNFERVHPPAR